MMPDIIPKSTAQKVAEHVVEDFEADLGPFVIAADTTRMPMIFTDAKRPQHPIIYANDSFLKLTGYHANEVLGQPIHFMLAEGGGAESTALIEQAFSNEQACDPEILCKRKDGSDFWASVTVNPVKEKSGMIVQHFASFIDLTRFKQEQTQLRMLIDELNHRVKNTMATVLSIVKQAGQNSADPVDVQKAIESRVFALARSHDLLTDEKWVGVGLADLVRNAVEPFCGSTMRCEAIGDNVRVVPEAAISLSIALHELATNAVKYGALSNDVGSVHISWTVEEHPSGKRLILVWEERGGPPVVPPTHRGFGSKVIERGLAYELQAVVNIQYRGDGVLCTINIPSP